MKKHAAREATYIINVSQTVSLRGRPASGHRLRPRSLAALATEAPLPPDPHSVLSGEQCAHPMQPTSDIFLGWITAPNGRQFYVRQLHDAKIKPLVETFDAEMLDAYAQACGWVLARAHAKASEISATISGYLGSSNDVFDTAMGKFALTYADQVERDHAALKTAVRKGEVATIKDDLGLS